LPVPRIRALGSTAQNSTGLPSNYFTPQSAAANAPAFNQFNYCCSAVNDSGIVSVPGPIEALAALAYGGAAALATDGAAESAVGLSGLGDLTTAEVNQIQAVVDQAGRPLNVVGSAASGTRTALSDIDYVVSPGSMPYFDGLESQLPGLDSHGVIPGAPNPFIGPSIPCNPTTFP
jgi:hypothetical protein